MQVGLVVAWYAGNTLYNVYNKKATNSKCLAIISEFLMIDAASI